MKIEIGYYSNRVSLHALGSLNTKISGALQQPKEGYLWREIDYKFFRVRYDHGQK